MKDSKISWTDHTFNFVIGCSKVSPGCSNCYADALAQRYGWAKWGPGQPRHRTSAAYWKQPIAWDREAQKTNTRPRIFCASLADWLDDEVPILWFVALLQLIHKTTHLDWLLLTKRPQNWRPRMEAAVATGLQNWNWLKGEAPENVWIGTSVENQEWADKRIPALLKIPARIRFLSCEPLLGPLDILPQIARVGITRIDWVIVGGESGPNARPMNLDRARSIRDQCAAAKVPFFFKQVGGCGKDKGGDILDGKQHHEWPA